MGLFADLNDPLVRDIVGVSEPVTPLDGDLDDGLVDEDGRFVAERKHDIPLDFEGWDDEYDEYAERLAEEAFVS